MHEQATDAYETEEPGAGVWPDVRHLCGRAEEGGLAGHRHWDLLTARDKKKEALTCTGERGKWVTPKPGPIKDHAQSRSSHFPGMLPKNSNRMSTQCSGYTKPNPGCQMIFALFWTGSTRREAHLIRPVGLAQLMSRT